MNSISSLPSYAEFTTILQKKSPNCSVAQIHGLLCGYICATSGEKNNQWITYLSEFQENKKALAMLQELYETSEQQLSEFSFEFTMLLPDDKTNLNLRAEALGLWCQGLLTGLEQMQVPIKNRAASEVTEALDDLIEISKISFGDIAENEEDETAYFELVEYVRLTTLMIFHELKSEKSQNDAQGDTSLH